MFGEPGDPGAKMGFMKDRVGIEVASGHSSFMGIDLLKFQVDSHSGVDKMDVGVYVVTTQNSQHRVSTEFGKNWDGSLTFEKVCRYLPHFRSAVQIPISVLRLDL